MATREQLGKLALVLMVCAAVFIPIGLLARANDDGGQSADARADELLASTPTPIPTPVPPTSTPSDSSNPLPTPTPLAISGTPAVLGLDEPDEPRQSGVPSSWCDVTGRFGNEHLTVATFEVPPTATASGCRSIAPGGWAAPHPAVRIDYQPNGDLITSLENAVRRPGDALELTDAQYSPSSVSTGWRLAYDHVDATIPDRGGLLRAILRVPARGGVLIVDSGDESWSETQRRQAHDLFDQVVSSLTPVERAGVTPQPGGLCSGNEWAAPIPQNWFAYNDCHHFNTSSEAPIAMQCECLGPFRVFELDRTTPLANTRVRADGLRYSITEEFRADDYIGDRDYRTISVELPSTTLVIEATRQVDHAFPGHTWEDTVRAQDDFLANLVVADVAAAETLEFQVRWPAVDDRDVGTIVRTPLGPDRWIISGRTPHDDSGDSLDDRHPIGLRGVVTRAASGRLSFDGTAWSPADGRNRCQVEGQDQQLRVTPSGAAWTLDITPCGSELDLIVDGLAAPIGRAECPDDVDPVVDNHMFSTDIDVDGDHIDEHAFVHMDAEGGPSAVALTVRFDDGHVISSAIDAADLGVQISPDLSFRPVVLEPSGAGHELLFIEAFVGDVPSFAVAIDPSGCAARLVAVLGDDDVSRWCTSPVDGDGGVVFREWKQIRTDDQRTVASDDALVRWQGSTLVRVARGDGPPPCGPDLPHADG